MHVGGEAGQGVYPPASGLASCWVVAQHNRLLARCRCTQIRIAWYHTSCSHHMSLKTLIGEKSTKCIQLVEVNVQRHVCC